MIEARDFKAFLWRHPELKGTWVASRVSEIKHSLERLAKNFIGRTVDAALALQLRYTFQTNLQQMIWINKLEDFQIYDVTPPRANYVALDVWLRLTRPVDKVVMNFVIKP